MKFFSRGIESERIRWTIFVTVCLFWAGAVRGQSEIQDLKKAIQTLQKISQKKSPDELQRAHARPWTTSTTSQLTNQLTKRLLPARRIPPYLVAANADRGMPYEDELLLPDRWPKLKSATPRDTDEPNVTATAPPPTAAQNTLSGNLIVQFDAAPEGASQVALQRGADQIEYSAQLNYSPFTNSTLFIRPTWNTILAPDTNHVSLNTVPGGYATKVGDTIIGWNQNKIFTWGAANDASFNMSGRYYAPTAEADRTTGQEAEFSLRGNVTQPISRWFTLLFDAKGWYAIQSQTYYVDPNNANNLKPNFDKEVTTYFTGVFRLNSVFAFNQSLGVDYSWMLGSYESDLPNPQGVTSLYIDSSISAKVSKGLEFRIGFNDEPSTNVPQPVQLFGPTDYYYYASVVLSF